MIAGIRKVAAVIAGVLIAGMGGVLYFGGARPLGGPLFFLGLGLAAWRGWDLWKSRPDPYDLKRLWDTEPEPGEDEPDEEWHEDRDTVYCHNCGHAVGKPFARCPDCGMQLR